MLSRSRRTVVVGAAVVVAIAALASRAFLAKEATDGRYRTEPASRGALVAEVTATGTVNPVTTVQVGTYVSGPIQEIHADFNSHVTKGQLVAKIDPRPFALRVQEAEASLAEARVNLEYTSIVSPVDGVVVSRSVDVGQTVAASFQTPTLFLIAGDLTKMQVDAN